MSNEFTLHLHGENAASEFFLSLGNDALCLNKSEDTVALKDPKIESKGTCDVGVQKIADSSLFIDLIFGSEDLYRVFKKAIDGRAYFLVDDTGENVSVEKMFGKKDMPQR